MIIGNNSNFSNNNHFLNNNFNNNKPVNNNFNNNSLTKDLSSFKYTDPKNKNDMYDKSLAMLKERYDNNLITLDEFNRKCNLIRKNREKNH